MPLRQLRFRTALVAIASPALTLLSACGAGDLGDGGIFDDGDDDGGDHAGDGGGDGDGGTVDMPGDSPLPPITVCAEGGDHATIQAAIDAADEDRTIEVCPGIYDENLVIDRSLALVGAGGADGVIIDAHGRGSGVVVKAVPAPGVALTGLTLRNGSSDLGGGIDCDTSTLWLDDVAVASSSAVSGGGLSARTCELAITASRFTGNTARGAGGGLHLVDSSGVLGESVIAGNAANEGGGIYQEEGAVAITGNDVHDNAAADGAGGIWHESDAPVQGNRIADNRAEMRGGGLSLIEHAATASKNVVTGNQSGDDGAGIFVFLSQATLADNEVTGNDAGADAGGIRVLGSQATITGNVVRGNTAVADGGGLKISHNQSVVRDNVFDGNSAGGYGGGIELDDDWSTLSRLVITNNSAHRGGGLHCHENATSFRVEHTLIAHNTADTSGGGVRLVEVTATATFSFVTIADNAAPEAGGADFAAAEEEVAPDAHTRKIVVASSIIANNEGVQVRFERGEIRGWDYTDVSPATFAGMDDPAGAAGNLSAPPRFVAPGAGDYHLRSDSPCRNAADPAVSDPDGTRADMGAYGGPGTLSLARAGSAW